jgi:hypothetical protein
VVANSLAAGGRAKTLIRGAIAVVILAVADLSLALAFSITALATFTRTIQQARRAIFFVIKFT